MDNPPVAPLVRSSVAVTLVGGGDVAAGDLALALAHAPHLVAADGGADAALALGHVPHAVIGDLDSLSDAARSRMGARNIHRIAEQDSTDFQKCLRAIDAPLILGVGFLGARLDHQLAAMTALGGTRTRCILIGARDVAMHLTRPLTMDLPLGSRLSLWPLARVAGRSKGLEWPIEGLDFAPAARIGTSNRVTGPVRLAMDGPGMLLILPRAALAVLIGALG
ncbi:thiamine pyrophosphokinase [Oceaniovalibus guishaninsula JLT2003]|uniref:Thiamine diphosphokinase n=1 Tax=Oceaniovalibus guishaninsula JLT2003 TaxID=1231392 RepID=K2I5Y0_9RHOB|nr:thiamine diphosphokinase [Oceaniovalibus guishaninsula]EKE44395.1 thiamine pyrophosphokinase [Oceaniovalibus guishaninsula JLT2003]